VRGTGEIFVGSGGDAAGEIDGGSDRFVKTFQVAVIGFGCEPDIGREAEAVELKWNDISDGLGKVRADHVVVEDLYDKGLMGSGLPRGEVNGAGFLWLAHEVEDALVLRQIDIHVDFEAAMEGVGRHGVPGAAGGKWREADDGVAKPVSGRWGRNIAENASSSTIFQ
jgi:hypothetical protein